MGDRNVQKKLEILARAAKDDVSCASSGSRRENRSGRLANASPSGICHSFTEDRRCGSLLKVLFTNFCIYDCAYCANRAGNDTPRAEAPAIPLAIERLSQRVRREARRMKGLVRFTKRNPIFFEP